MFLEETSVGQLCGTESGRSMAMMAGTKRRVPRGAASAKDSESTIAPEEPRPETPSADVLAKFALPSSYKIKYCKLCSNSSITEVEIDLDQSAWMGLLPWGNGTRTMPSGVFCRPEGGSR